MAEILANMIIQGKITMEKVESIPQYAVYKPYILTILEEKGYTEEV